MERVAKLLLPLAFFLVLFAVNDVEGARTMKNKEMVDQPQNFFGGTGGALPPPAFTSGSVPPLNPNPNPGFTFGPPGAGAFCSFFPGSAGCTPPMPTIPGRSIGGSPP
ncbi:hypothetical protein NMG60_11020960 [Bertholletia excelsa]